MINAVHPHIIGKHPLSATKTSKWRETMIDCFFNTLLCGKTPQLYIKRLSLFYEEKCLSAPQREFWQHMVHIRSVIKVHSLRSYPPRTERKLLSGFSTLPSQIADNRLVAKTCHRSPPVTRQLDLSCYSVLVYHTHLFCCDFQKGFSRCLL